MKLMSFAEINDAENGQQIPSFQGTLKKVFEQKSGEGNYGPWTLQNLILQDQHANEITVTWTAADEWSTKDEGKLLHFESGHDKKDQLCGLQKQIRRKDGKVYESVKVDDRAKVKVVNGQPPTKSEEPTWGEEEPQIAPESSVNAPVARPNGNGGLMETRKHLMQSVNLLRLCVRAVNSGLAPHVPVIAQTAEFFQAQVASLFIESSRAGYVGKMPTVPLENEEPY